MLPYCHRCGALLDENTRFCHKCGTAVAGAAGYMPYVPPPPSAQPLHKDPWILGVVALVAAFLVVMVVLAFYGSPYFTMDFNQTSPGNFNLNSFSANLPLALFF